MSGRSGVNADARDVVFLWNTGWDDWFQFETLHSLVYVDLDGRRRALGDVKIGQDGLIGARAGQAQPGMRRPTLPQRFNMLPVEFFSLGQDDSFYEALGEVGPQFRATVLSGLRDIAYDPEVRRHALGELVTSVSLLRTVTLKTVEEQFARMAHGGARLTPYSITYVPTSTEPRPRLSFAVKPNSRPPSNIHVVIGRNGVGKSTMLNGLARVMVERSRADDAAPGPWQQLSNVVSVSFSAFDEFKPMPQSQERARGLSYHYVGLKKVAAREGGTTTMADHEIKEEMTSSLRLCLVGARRARLRHALSLLETDPMFAEAGLAGILEAPEAWDYRPDTEGIDGGGAVEEAITEFGAGFRRLSSGHKIVLLSISRLVETVEERSLVLLDEPEAHLHPPLLSAFVRALSDLLTNRNGMAVIATHSPVVLQEVPRSCVWKLSRSGRRLRAERPRVETFGENVGILTDEVFGLEVTGTGFHRMLDEAATESTTYEEALASFDGQLGSEGRAILRAMMATFHPTPGHVGG